MDPDRWQQISHLYQAALEREPGQRPGFLDEACRGDNELRREVETLLACEPSGEGFLDVPALERAAMSVAKPPARPMVGEQIGPYRILSPLGSGGMGEVYRAHDGKLGRDVALKVLPQDLADDPDRRARMLREARAAASLNHPNICTIYEVGEAGGRIYIAMEVIEGQPLSARLADRALPLDEVLRIGLQLSDAVAHAHDRGIVHRDLKGANVMITPDGRVKVLDFGLAKRVIGQQLTEAITQPAAPLTKPHAILGTLPYMSPEQLRGQPAEASSDVWALGVILYEMAAGARPFDGGTGFEVSSAILREDPPPLPPRVPAPLQTVVSRCLEKEPPRRYQRANEVRAALETVRAGDVVPVPERVDVAHRRWVIGAVSLAVVVALAGALWWSRAGSQRASGAPAGQIQSIAVLPLENLSGDAAEEYFVTGMHEALITDLARIGLQKVIAKASVDVFKGTKKPLSDIARELGVEGVVTGSVMRASNRVQVTAQLVRADTGAVVWANRYERNAGDVLALQNEVVSAIAREVRANLSAAQKSRLADARPVNAAAYDAYLKGRSSFASMTNTANPKYLDAAIQQLEQAIQIDPTYAPAYAALSASYVTMSQISSRPPKDTFPQARAAALKAVELDDELAASHAALANVFLWYDWNWAGAAREIQRALQLNPDSVDALTASVTYLTLVAGQADDAAATSQRNLAVDPLNPFSRVQPVWVAYFSRRYDESIAGAKTLVELQPNNVMGPWFLASAYAAKRMKQQVVDECDKVMKLLGGAYVMQAIAECVSELGVVGETARARQLLERLEHPPSGIWLDPPPMGNAYAGLGDIDRAVMWYQRGLDERSPNMIYMKTATSVDPVRQDPRFQSILRQMNFPQ